MKKYETLRIEASELLEKADEMIAKANHMLEQARQDEKAENIASCSIKVGDTVKAMDDFGGGDMVVQQVFGKQNGEMRLLKGVSASDGLVAYALSDD